MGIEKRRKGVRGDGGQKEEKRNSKSGLEKE